MASPTIRLHRIAAALVLLVACAHWARSPRFGSLVPEDRPFSFAHDIDLAQVTNGMKLALVRDTRTNLVTVDMRYLVGAAEDPKDRAGLAHLTEHLLFMSRREAGGATLGDELSDLALYHNAYTTVDETHYTATAPVENLDALIALESRRMQTRCDQLDDATFARERDVVLAEEAERASPLDGVRRELLATVYDDGPYARGLGGGIASARKEDVCAFIAAHYTPDRAILVVTGPIDVAATKQKIGRAFGPIATHAAAPRVRIDPPLFDGETSQHEAPIEYPTAMVFLPYPAWGASGRQVASLARLGIASKLNSAAVDLDWVRDTSVSLEGGARAPVLVATVSVADASHLAEAAGLVFTAAEETATSVRTDGHVLAARRGEAALALIAHWDDLGGRGGWIADYLQYTDHTWFMLKDMAELARVTGRQVAEAAESATRARSHVALVSAVPGKHADAHVTLRAPGGGHDLVPWRTPVDADEATRPLPAQPTSLAHRVETFDLENGLHVILASDERSPIVTARLVFPAGSAHEPRARPGLATAAAQLLWIDYEGYFDNRQDINRIQWAFTLGTQTDTEVGETSTTFSASGLALYADWHVWQLSWLLDQGVYNDVFIEALRKNARKRDAQADAEVDRDALTFRERLFGKGSPYATPPYRPRALLAIDRDDLDGWKRAHYRARGATLIVSGGFDSEAMRREIQELFGPWSGDAPAALPAVPRSQPGQGPSWLAVRDPDAVLVGLVIGFATTSDPVADAAARRVLALMLEDRLRLVREGMGASYGVNVSYALGASGGALLVSGDVDPAQAGAVLARLLAELESLRQGSGQDAARADFVRARRRALAGALAYGGGAARLADTLEALTIAGLPIDRARAVALEIARLTPAQVARVAAADLAQERMVVRVAGASTDVDATYAAIGKRPE